MSNVELKSYLQYNFVVFLWGFTGILGALITIDATPLVWFRTLLATVSIYIWILIRKKNIKLAPKKLFYLFLIGAVLAIHWLVFFMAIKESIVSIAVALVSTGAFFTSILEPIFYKRKVIWYEIFFGLVVVFGLFLIFRVETEYITGILLALLSAFLYAVFTLMNGKTTKEDATVVAFYELFFGTILLSLYLFYLSFGSDGNGFTAGFFNISGLNYTYLIVLGTLCTAYPIIAAVKVMKHLSPYTLMLTLNLEPVYGILLALLIFGKEEKMNPAFYFGAAIILITVVLNVLLKSKLKIKDKVSKSCL